MITAYRGSDQADTWVRRVERAKANIDMLAATLYNTDATDPQLRYTNLKTYRVEIMRGFVLYMHLAIEDLLRAILFDFLARRNRRSSNRELRRVVDGMRSSELIGWCGRLNLLKPKQRAALVELNRVRNACAHRWVLDLAKHKRIAPGKRKRLPVVIFRGKNLFGPRAFLDDFCPEYGPIYLKLLSRVWKLQGKI